MAGADDTNPDNDRYVSDYEGAIIRLRSKIVRLNVRIMELEDMLEAFGSEPYAVGSPIAQWAQARREARNANDAMLHQTKE